MSGLLISCNRGREAKCVSETRDLYRLLSHKKSNDPADDNLAGESRLQPAADFSSALEEEIATLRKDKVEQIRLGDTKCLVFMRHTAPLKFIDDLFASLKNREYYPK